MPVYVTETGIPDRTGDKREKFFETYIPQVRASCNAAWAQTSNTHALSCSMAAISWPETQQTCRVMCVVSLSAVMS